MKISEVKHGMQVVVSEAPTTKVYKVEEVRGFEALVSYESSGRTCQSLIDVSCLRKPTKLQLRNTSKA